MSNDTYVFSELHERAKGNREETTEMHPLAGMLPDQNQASVLADVGRAFEGRAVEFADTRRGRRIAGQVKSRGVSRAVSTHDNPLGEYMRGISDDKTSIQGFDLWREISEVMAQPASVTTVKGDMGSGKTDFAGLLAEAIEFGLFQRYGREYEVKIGTNVWSFVEEANSREDDETENQPWHVEWEYIDNFRDLVDRFDAQKESGAYEDERYIYILDEGSNHVTGYGQDANDAVEMGKMIRLIRKGNGSMIVIGHSHDIAPIILRMSNLIIEKLSEQEADDPKKEARVYKRAGEDKDARDLELIDSLKEIPGTKYEFDTHESSDFLWGDEDGEEMFTQAEVDEMIESVKGKLNREWRDRMIHSLSVDYNVIHAEIAEQFDLSEQRIGGIVSEQEEKRNTESGKTEAVAD